MHRSAAGSVFISIAQAAKGEWSLFFQILHHTVQFLLHFLVTADVEFRQLLGAALEAADAYRLIGRITQMRPSSSSASIWASKAL